MFSITQRIEFCAGHRILGHEGKCRHLHGHNYYAEVTFSAVRTNELGMVVDFADVKAVVKKWIDDHWDHNMILHIADPLLEVGGSINGRLFDGKYPYVMSHGNRPTAEAMAEELWEVVTRLISKDPKFENVYCTQIKIQETENNSAYYFSTTGAI